MRVLIAGGGIGGLTAALALLEHGIDVDVYEQAAELKEVGAGVQLGARGRGFVQDDDSVTLQLENGVSARGDALIGADGVHSRIRQSLFGPDRAEFTGFIAWRGMVPTAQLPAHMARRVGSNWVGP